MLHVIATIILESHGKGWPQELLDNLLLLKYLQLTNINLSEL